MKMFSVVKTIALSAVVGASGLSGAHANAMDDFRGFLTNTQSARSEFSQTVYDSRGKVTQQASGTLAFARPGKFRWQYLKPAQTIVGDGTKVSFYDVDLNQVTVRKLEKAFSSTPAALLAGKSEVEAAFTLVAGGEADGMDWVNAEPKSKDAGIEKVRMGFVKSQLAAMELHDSFGNRTRIVFSKFERNAKIDAKEFTFVAPKGADVISE
jgi:outer membrane lipoprotein carrier protein